MSARRNGKRAPAAQATTARKSAAAPKSTAPVRLAVAGCTGRTGSAVLRLAAADPAFKIVAALTGADDSRLGQDAGPTVGLDPLGIRISAAFPTSANTQTPSAAPASDVLIEFSTPAACRQWAEWCAAHGVALVSGTTGLGEHEHAALEAAAQRVTVVQAPNMSVGVNLLLRLVAEAARVLGPEWDVEIAETHHRHKVDAPSGTAKALLAAIAEARGAAPNELAVPGRMGQCGPRRTGDVGVHALRMGEVVGDHEVHFAAAGEIVTLSHRALSRETFAAGALRAARWVIGQAPGLYGMRDVLGI
jgi:4-hydroxy-tetrahydrodipicolinate reductase